MDIKDLNKSQLILLTLLITFIVSIATGIVTVSLMQQMPKSVPQTINRVIQQTIEKVNTVQVPVDTATKKSDVNFSDGAVLASIYNKNYATQTIDTIPSGIPVIEPAKSLGQGVIISDSGLILVEGSVLLNGEDSYKIMLGKDIFDAKILKKFNNGFAILQIVAPVKTDVKKDTVGTKQGSAALGASASSAIPAPQVDKVQ